MKIAINTRLLLKDKMDGIGRFTFETFKLITEQHSEVKFVFLFDRKFDEQFIFSNNITPVVVPPPTRHPLLYKIWFDFALPLVFKIQKPDLFVSPDGFLSLNSKVKSLPVIHDLNFVHFPDKVSMYAKLYNHNFPLYAKQAARIATVSEFSKQDIVNSYGINPQKIDVVYNGVSSIYKNVNDETKQTTKNKYSLGKNYFVFVGSLYKRKNIQNLLLAFNQFKLATQSDVKLLIVGRKIWWSNDVEILFENLECKNDVVFTGRVNDHELKNILASAIALTYVSLFEGFGIPVLEAMKCDVPVIASNTTSLPEVAGDAALLVNPESVDSIAEAMKKFFSDEVLRNHLITKSKLQREKFSWQRTADLMWTSILSCIEIK